MTNCANCGEPLPRRPPSKSGRPFCSRTCYWASMRGQYKTDDPKRPRIRRVPGHPIAPPSGIISEGRLALFEKIGEGPHPCHWCQQPVTWNPRSGASPRLGDLVVDHLDWNALNDAPENLVPSCTSCNSHRAENGKAPLIRDGEPTIMVSGWRTRAVKRYCNICGKEFLTLPSAAAKGRGLYCSRSCARRGPRAARRAP